MHESFFGGCALFISVHNFRSYPAGRAAEQEPVAGAQSVCLEDFLAVVFAENVAYERQVLWRQHDIFETASGLVATSGVEQAPLAIRSGTLSTTARSAGREGAEARPWRMASRSLANRWWCFCRSSSEIHLLCRPAKCIQISF